MVHKQAVPKTLPRLQPWKQDYKLYKHGSQVVHKQAVPKTTRTVLGSNTKLVLTGEKQS